jgi:hypothetical protein
MYYRFGTGIRALGFVIFVCASSAVQSNDKDTGFDFIDCSFTAKKIGDDVWESKIQKSYRISNDNENFDTYDTELNEYVNVCSQGCTINKDKIQWYSQNDKNSYKLDIVSLFSINRWNGEFQGETTTFKLDNYASNKYKYSGECQSGISKLKTKPKF